MHALLRLRLNRSLRDRIEWRHGFLAAVDRRTFPGLPPALTDAEVTGNSKESKAFAEGFHHGMTYPLAVSVPEHDVEQFDGEDQYTTFAFACFVILIVGTATLYFQSI